MAMCSVVLMLLAVFFDNTLALYNFSHDDVFEIEYEKIRIRRQGVEGKCILPPYPANGQYTVTGADATTATPGKSLPAAQIVVHCSGGYQPVGTETLYCVNGEWSSDMPTCVLACRLDPHPSVTYNCYRSDEDYRKCKVFEPSGTIVKPQCNAPNYYYSGALSYMRCIEGRWNYVAVCQPECGKITPHGKPLIIEGRQAKRGEFPWHAGVYLKTSDPYKLICGGSIVSSSIIISAAHCFWHKEQVRPASEVAIAVGKVYRGWNNPMDDEAQKFDVKSIKVPARYQDARGNYQDDVAILTLSALIVYRPYVRPVCVDFDEIFDRHQLKDGNIGKVAGWGLQDTDGTPSPVLKVLEMPYVRVERCIDEAPASFRPYITSDKICAGYSNGSSLCRGDSGGGLVFPALDHGTSRYYLRGLVSTAPDSSDQCNALARTSFTHVTHHKTFIEENTIIFETPTVVQQEAVSLCTLPPFPENGRYDVDGTIGASPGQTFFTAQVRVRCDEGFTPNGNVALSCSYGRWSGDLPQCVVKGCALPTNPKLRYRCFNKQAQQWPCKSLEPNGTYSLVDCAVGYKPVKPARDVMRCDGEWRIHDGAAATVECTTDGNPSGSRLPSPLLNLEEQWPCKSLEPNGTYSLVDCAVGYKPVKPARDVMRCDGEWRIHDGAAATVECTTECGSIVPGGSEAPWTAALFKLETNLNLICGGTIVSRNHVITAAHCVWDSATNTPEDPSAFEVLVGAKYPFIGDDRDQGHTQSSKVSLLNVSESFYGLTTNYGGDLAVLTLTTPLEFSKWVQPACLDFDEQAERMDYKGGFGMTASWSVVDDKNEVDHDGAHLSTVLVSHLETRACIERAEDKRRAEYVTVDKQCFTANEGRGSCVGDSGLGVVFPRNTSTGQQYFLRGIVSIAFAPMRCSMTDPFGATHILKYRDFLRNNGFGS